VLKVVIIKSDRAVMLCDCTVSVESDNADEATAAMKKIYADLNKKEVIEYGKEN
jgi:hypothetical protein